MATVHGLLSDTANRRPEAIALTLGGVHTTYAEIIAEADRTAAFLAEQGVARGDRIALLMDNSPDYVAAFFGALRAGACVVALNHANRAKTHRALLRDSGAVGLLTRGREARNLPDIIADCPDLRFAVTDKRNPRWELPASCDQLTPDDVDAAPEFTRVNVGADDLAVILYTSGSTGRPRGVTLTHGNLVANTEQILGYLPLDETDSVCCVLPFHYSFGNSLLLTHVKQGGRVVIDNRFAFPQKVMETLEDERCTGFSGVPSHYAILAARTDFLARPHKHLRYLTQAGGAMSPALTRRIREAMPERF
ncbi:acyl--CoA ligase [bacterium]|nr:acyl--CoA ligase [bacterium]